MLSYIISQIVNSNLVKDFLFSIRLSKSPTFTTSQIISKHKKILTSNRLIDTNQ